MHCGSAPCRARGTGPSGHRILTLPRLLLDRGRSKTGAHEPAMAAQLAALADDAHGHRAAGPLSRTPLPSTSTCQVLAAGFGRGAQGRPTGLAGVFAVIGLEPAQSMAPLSSARWQTILSPPPAPCSTDSTAGILFSSSRRPERSAGRGSGAAITLRSDQRHAARTGATFAVRGSSPMGQRIYDRGSDSADRSSPLGSSSWTRSRRCARPRRAPRELRHVEPAGAEGLEPPTYGFGDRRSTN